MDFNNLRRLVSAAEGSTLYSKLVNLRKDQRSVQTIFKDQRSVQTIFFILREEEERRMRRGGTFEALYGADEYGGET